MASLLSGILPLIRQVHLKQAPFVWLMNLNRTVLAIFFAIASFTSLVQSIAILGAMPRLEFIAITPWWAVTLLGAFIFWKHLLHRVCAEMCLLCGLVNALNTISCVYAAVSGQSASVPIAWRMRSQGLNCVAFKVFPALFGIPPLPAAICILWSFLMDIFSSELSHLINDDPSELPMHITDFLAALVSFAISCLISNRWCSIFDAEQALASEKSLMEKIITMLCDAMIWLPANARTVVATDDRFKMLMGRDMTGESLDSLLTYADRERVKEFLALATTSPALMPTTVVTNAGAEIKAEMFIVGSRNPSSATGSMKQSPAFLIGVRLEASDCCVALGDGPNLGNAISELGTESSVANDLVPPIPQSAGAGLDMANPLPQGCSNLADNIPDPWEVSSSAHSVPKSTMTGRIFDSVDVDRRLEGTPEDRMSELVDSLETVATLGRTEGWLLSSTDIKIDNDQVLGVGGFGCVTCAFLHGSAVAMKKINYHTDIAGTKKLASLANEIRILRHARHPNIVLFFGAVLDSSRFELLLVLERINGPVLHAYVEMHFADTDIHKRFQLLLDTACALRYLHAQLPQIVHGDLKSSNILVDPRIPLAKLVDFGLSRMLTHGAQPLSGTLRWMAPELICGQNSKPNPSADVFSFGRVAYLIITSRMPLATIAPKVILNMARQGGTHHIMWDENKPLHKEGRNICSRLGLFVPEQRPSMATVHQEVSSWVLPQFEEYAPLLENAVVSSGGKASSRSHSKSADRGPRIFALPFLRGRLWSLPSQKERVVQQSPPDTEEEVSTAPTAADVTLSAGNEDLFNQHEVMEEPSLAGNQCAVSL